MTKTIKIAVPFIWFGMVLAISFIEAPLKFQAPGITLPLGLGIGRLIFFALNKAEIICLLLLIFAMWRERSANLSDKVLTASLIVIIALETAWLLPALDVRAGLVIAGTEAPFSNLHLVYIAFEVVKIVVLLTLGIITVRRYIGASEK